MKRRSALFLLAGIVAGSVLATPAQQMLLSGGAVPAVWSTITGLPAARQYNSMTGASNTAAINFGGATTGAVGQTTCESWDGVSWTAGTALPTSNYATDGAAGTPTSSVLTGGTGTFGTRTYNGSAWTVQGDIPDGRGSFGKNSQVAMCGASATAALEAAGIQNNNGFDTSTAATFNGTAWSAVATMTTARSGGGLAGSSTSAVYVTGHGATTCENWNGTAWSAGGNTITATYINNRASGATSAAAVRTGGAGGGVTTCETYASNVWSTANGMGTARANHGTAGTPASGLVAGGWNGSAAITSAEKFQ